MIEPKINDLTFITLAVKHYDNVQCLSIQELNNDIRKFSHLRKLFHKYHTCSKINERLILNHIITLYNLFGQITTEFLFFKIDRDYWSYLITFLRYLERMPEHVPEFGIMSGNYLDDVVILVKLKEL